MIVARADPIQFQSTLDGNTITVNPSKMIVESIISTANPDRAGDIVLPSGLQNAQEYLQNPVVLWAHQRTMPPIGTCEFLDVKEDRIIARTRFSQSTPFAGELFHLYAEGILRGWSIGFLPLQTRPRSRRGQIVEAWDLLEYSAVPIPENPEALTLAIRKGVIQDDALLHWLDRFQDDLFSELLVPISGRKAA